VKGPRRRPRRSRAYRGDQTDAAAPGRGRRGSPWTTSPSTSTPAPSPAPTGLPGPSTTSRKRPPSAPPAAACPPTPAVHDLQDRTQASSCTPHDALYWRARPAATWAAKPELRKHPTGNTDPWSNAPSPGLIGPKGPLPPNCATAAYPPTTGGYTPGWPPLKPAPAYSNLGLTPWTHHLEPGQPTGLTHPSIPVHPRPGWAGDHLSTLGVWGGAVQGPARSGLTPADHDQPGPIRISHWTSRMPTRDRDEQAR